MVTRERVLELLRYEPETGKFYWRVNRGGTARKGTLAGSVNKVGYWIIRIDQRDYLAHRLVWLVEVGEWPKEMLDHIDRQTTNNRLENLREATQAENQQNLPKKKNNRSGFVGVSWHTAMGRWRATIFHNYKQHFLGYFDTPEGAAKAYAAAKAQLHTFHPEVAQ